MEQAGSSVPLEDPPPSLKALLSAGTALLQPPAPLPANPPDLLARLKASSARLPLFWRGIRPEWSEDTELEQVGDDDTSNAVRRKIRRDDLVMIVAKRSLSLLAGMQKWLEKECWPEALRPGLKPADYMLGGVDNKLVQLLVSHTVSSLLLQLSITYEAHLKTNNGHQTASELSSALQEVLNLLAAPQVPPQPCGPSSSPRLPFTLITTNLVKHVPNILLSCVLIAYTPTTEPKVHLKLRQQYVQTLNQMGPATALTALGSTLQILVSGQKDKSPVRGWFRAWPSYVAQTVRQTMSAQIAVPGGARGLISYIFSDPAVSTPDERRLEIIAKTLSSIPKGQTQDKYIPRVLDDLVLLIAMNDPKPPPKIFVHAAAYGIFKLWEKYRELTETWMNRLLRIPEVPSGWAQKDSLDPRGVVISSETCSRVIKSFTTLSIYAPPSSIEYRSRLLVPNFQPLFALFAHRYMAIDSAEIREIAKRGKSTTTRSTSTAADILLIFDTWFRIATKTQAVNALWDLVTARSNWKRSLESDKYVGWQGPAGHEEAAIKFTHPTEPSKLETSEVTDMSTILNGITIDPVPDALVALLRAIERPEVASEIFLKMLNEWRAVHNGKNAPRLLAVHYLRIVSRILEVFGPKLLTTPEHILLFIEGTLSDAITSESELLQPKVTVLDVPTEVKILTDADEIDQFSPVDISLRLMLALLAGLEATDEMKRLLLPIGSHVEYLASTTDSSEICRLSKEVLQKLEELQLKPTAALTDSIQSIYDKALELLRDQLLPVRAHGLKMLSDLVMDPEYDTSMTPRILEQFQHALTDDDSFIYLQASKQLVRMVYTLGPTVFRAVWKMYVEAMEGSRKASSEQAIDKVLRVGETMDAIITASGTALSIHAATVVPVLRNTFADATLPTIVRASALAILSSCVTADHLALLPWARELLSGTVDLLQVESVRDSPFKPIVLKTDSVPVKPKIVLVEDEEPEPESSTEAPQEELPRTIDEEPTKANDGKHPALRRAAVSFLDNLFDHLYKSNQPADSAPPTAIHFQAPKPQPLPSLDANAMLGYDVPLIQSALPPLLYIAETDIDETTRAQATSAAASACALIDLMTLTNL